VRILTDFRRLNAQIKRKPFPLPKISDLLRKLRGFKYATAIDLSMGYYHIPLDLEVQKLCTTILRWGKYQYKRLPMGIKISPDIFQRGMYEVLGDIPNIQVYLYDTAITSNMTGRYITCALAKNSTKVTGTFLFPPKNIGRNPKKRICIISQCDRERS
jgi:dihydroorotate dehydrogenase